MAMWGLYSLPWENAVRISIPKKKMKKWLESIEKCDGVITEPSFAKNRLDSKFKKTLSDIVYTDGKVDFDDSKLYWFNRTNDISQTVQLRGIGREPQMTVFIKNAAWKYENEVRLNICTRDIVPYDKIAVDIPQDVIDGMIITSGPYFQGNIITKIQELIPDKIAATKILESGFKGLVNYRTLCSICGNNYKRTQ